MGVGDAGDGQQVLPSQAHESMAEGAPRKTSYSRHVLSPEKEAEALAWVHSWRHRFIVSTVIAGFTAGFLVLFTSMGVGVWYTIKTHHLSWYSWALGCAAQFAG